MLKFGTKNALFGYFYKTIVVFEISTLKFAKNEFLTHTVKFGVESAFSIGPGSAFFQGPDPCLGLLFKLCLKKHGTELNNINKPLGKMIFRDTKDFLKFNVNQEDITIRITS